MASFLAPPAYKPEQTGPEADAKYKRLRWQVFIGIFIGYAGFYLVRQNMSMVKPLLTGTTFGYTNAEVATAASSLSIAYALSKFLMGSISDRSNARKFLPLGLILTAVAMFFMMVPINIWGKTNHALTIGCLTVCNFLVGWFSGMGWPPCGRVLAHWFSPKERGSWMSVWNCAHNVGGALMPLMVPLGAAAFGSWVYGQNKEMYTLVGAFAFPSAVAILVAIIAYILIRDTPQSCGLPAVEKWRNDFPKGYSEKSETVLSFQEIFLKYVLPNKFLWFIAFANVFVYMVRYGCFTWAPTFLKAEHGFDITQAGWVNSLYEWAAIPGTILCGFISDKVFNGKRAMPTIIFMALVAIFVFLYWQFSSNTIMVYVCMIAIGCLIYGPVMLIGVQALDLAPKNAAGTAAGLTGFFGYFFGTAILSEYVLGKVADAYGWNATFVCLLIACGLSILFMSLTYKEENKKALEEKK